MEKGEEISYTYDVLNRLSIVIGGNVTTYNYDKVASPSSFGGMSKVDASGYQNYWNQVKHGVSVEQRYNLQKFGAIDTVNTIGNLKLYNGLRNVEVDSLSLTRSLGYDISGVKKLLTLDMRDLTIKEKKYLEHIESEGTNSNGKGTLSIPIEEVQRLVNEYSGKGKVIQNNRERVDFGTVIGKYKSKDGKVVLDTTVGIVHYSKDGAHIVPARPNK